MELKLAVSALEQIPEDSTQYVEAQAKIAEYQANRETARKQYQELRDQVAARRNTAEERAAARRNEAVEIFMTQVREIDPNGSLVARAELSEFDEDGKTIIITVTTNWHAQPKPIQEDAATGLYNLWVAARLASGDSRDEMPFMRLETASGTEVIGYGPLKGIYIKD